MPGTLTHLVGNTAVGRLVRPEIGAWPIVLALGLLVSLLEGVSIGLLVPIAVFLLAPQEAASLPEPFPALLAMIGMDRGDVPALSAIATIGAVMLAGIVLKTALQWANSVLIAKIDVGIAGRLIDGLADRILAMDYADYLKSERARLLQALSTDSWEVAEAVRAGLSLLPALAGLAIFGLILLWLDAALAALVVVSSGVLWLVLRLIERRQQALGAAATERHRALGWRMLWIVEGARTIRLFGENRREKERFAALNSATAASVLQVGRLAALTGPLSELLLALVFLAVLFAGIVFGRDAATLAAFLLILLRSYPYAARLSQARVEVAARHGAVSEVEWLLGRQEGPAGFAGSAEVALTQPIEFRGVSYTYPGREPALRDVNCTVPAGEITALIGPTGAGKSTFVTLLSRLVAPSSGEIWLGQTDAAKIAPGPWRRRLAYAGQDIALVEGTVAQNIAFGSPDASAEEIDQAARAAGALPMIDALPDGMDTPLGPGGLALSGGQRQRIALARALLRRPDILVLDEATSAIDAPSEADIVELLRSREFFTAAIVISHRRSTLAACSHGIVLERGTVTETGPLSELAYFATLEETPP